VRKEAKSSRGGTDAHLSEILWLYEVSRVVHWRRRTRSHGVRKDEAKLKKSIIWMGTLTILWMAIGDGMIYAEGVKT